MKTLTWQTANQESNTYDLTEFIRRSYGWHYDPVALVYSCLVRQEINNGKNQYMKTQGKTSGFTSTFHFLRQGKHWLRNPEFGQDTKFHLEQIRNNNNIVRNHSTGDITHNGMSLPANPTLVDGMLSGMFLDYYDVAE